MSWVARAPAAESAHVLPHVSGGPASTDGVHYVTGPWRAEVEGDAVVWAEDAFLTTIEGSTPVADGWVFVTRDGVVARSATFTGRLERLDQLPSWRR